MNPICISSAYCILLECLVVGHGTVYEGYHLATKEEVKRNKLLILKQMSDWGIASLVGGTVSNRIRILSYNETCLG